MNIQVIIEYDEETDSYAAYCPELPGCTSAGDTEKEAIDNIREAILLYLQPIPVRPAPGHKVVEIEVPV